MTKGKIIKEKKEANEKGCKEGRKRGKEFDYGPFITGLHQLAQLSAPEEQEDKSGRISLSQGWYIPHIQ